MSRQPFSTPLSATLSLHMSISPHSSADRTHPDYVWQLKGAMHGRFFSGINTSTLSHRSLDPTGILEIMGYTSSNSLLVSLWSHSSWMVKIIAIPTESSISDIKRQPFSVYSMKDLGSVKKLLGISIVRTLTSISPTFTHL